MTDKKETHGGLLGSVRKWASGRRAATSARRQSDLDRRLVMSLSGRRLPTRSQLKHLGRYLSTAEKRIIAFLTAVIMICMGGIAYTYVTDHIHEVPAEGGTYVEASVGGPRYVNPILAASNDADLDIARLVFNGLMRTDRTGELVPDLAESYDIDDEGKVYTFRLRRGVKWHDGAPFGSYDVAATIGYIQDPGWKSPYQAQFKNVTVETPDEWTVVFRLEEPFAPFLSALTIGILPSHLWQEVMPENSSRAELNIKPVGTGQFRFKKFTKDKKGTIRSYHLASNDEYHGQKAMLSEVVFTFYQDFGLAKDALVDRKVDGMSFLPLEFREEVEKASSLRIYTLRLPQYTAVFFNEKRNPALESQAVRRALALAVDKVDLVSQTLGHNAVPVHGPILPGFVGFHPDVKRYRYEPSQAAELLDEAGWTPGDGGIRTKNMEGADGEKVDTPLTITLTTVDTKENMAVAQLIASSWQAVGVKVELEIVPSSRIQMDKIRERSYDALLYGEILGPDPDPFPFWHSSQGEKHGLNLSGFSNRRVDELLEQARVETDTEKRAEMYREFQDILADQVPAIFLYSPTYSYVVDRRVENIQDTTIFTPSDRFTSIADWYVRTKQVWK